MILRENDFLDFIDSLLNDHCIFVESERTLYGDIDEFFNESSILFDLPDHHGFPFYEFSVSINNGSSSIISFFIFFVCFRFSTHKTITKIHQNFKVSAKSIFLFGIAFENQKVAKMKSIFLFGKKGKKLQKKRHVL